MIARLAFFKIGSTIAFFSVHRCHDFPCTDPDADALCPIVYRESSIEYDGLTALGRRGQSMSSQLRRAILPTRGHTSVDLSLVVGLHRAHPLLIGVELRVP